MAWKTTKVIEPHEIADWTLQCIGGAYMACHEDMGARGFNARARWVGRNLLQLGRAIRALAIVAAKHPEEFREALGVPIELELMEALRCESTKVHFGLLIQCERDRHETGEHQCQDMRWRG